MSRCGDGIVVGTDRGQCEILRGVDEEAAFAFKGKW